MILVRELKDGFSNEKHVYWTEQCKADDIDTLVSTMNEAMESEGITKPRSFEIIEVTVTRKVVVEREIQQHVIVNVTEREEVA